MTTTFDFPNAQRPSLTPLRLSHEDDDVEADLKSIFLDLFDAKIADAFFDCNVLGSAHLGSFDLVRKIVNSDGLSLVDGDFLESATRYLYRAWNSGNNQGRGARFLKTYLQLLFQQEPEIYQLWQAKSATYPNVLYEHERNDCFLTSRIRIYLADLPELEIIARIYQSVRSVVPARLVASLAYRIDPLLTAINVASMVLASSHVDSSGELQGKLDFSFRETVSESSFIQPSQHIVTQGVLN